MNNHEEEDYEQAEEEMLYYELVYKTNETDRQDFLYPEVNNG